MTSQPNDIKYKLKNTFVLFLYTKILLLQNNPRRNIVHYWVLRNYILKKILTVKCPD